MDSRNEGRVYVRRRGRSTVAQERALSELAPRYLVTPPAQEEPSARGSARGLPSKKEPSAGGSARGLPSQEERSARGLPSKKEPWDEAFGRPGPLLVEIGFGMGDALAAFAKVPTKTGTASASRSIAPASAP